MPRRRKHVTERTSKNLFAHQQAYEELLVGRSLRQAAVMFDLDHVSLSVSADDNMREDEISSSSCESSASENKESPPYVQSEDWVIVNIIFMKNLVHSYVGQIQSVRQQGYMVRFAKKLDNHKFKWPVKDDISEIAGYQVVKKIGRPAIKSNSRRVIHLEFKKSLRKFKIE